MFRKHYCPARVNSIKKLGTALIFLSPFCPCRFSRLSALEELVLDGSDLSMIENDAFSLLSSLSSLSAAAAAGLDFFPVSLLEGPKDSLTYLDLSYVNLFPDRLDDDAFFQVNMEENTFYD